jgi:hypothetical protein
LAASLSYNSHFTLYSKQTEAHPSSALLQATTVVVESKSNSSFKKVEQIKFSNPD